MAHPAETDHPVIDAVRNRWSPYRFADRAVSEDDLRSLFEAARWAPSSYNEQPWSYVVARREDAGAFEKLLSCLVEANQAWARSAAALALGVVHTRFRRNDRENPAAEHDLGLASGALLAEATARGIYVHQMIGILPDRARELYAIPEGVVAKTALAIGHVEGREEPPEDLAAREKGSRRRKPLAEFVFGASFGERADFA